MPYSSEQAIDNTTKTFEHEFTFMYQTFKLTLEYYQVRPGEGFPPRVLVDANVEQLRSGQWENRGFTPASTTPFMSPSRMTGFTLFGETNRVPKEIVGHKLRPQLKDLVVSLLQTQWTYSNTPYDEDDPSPSEANARRALLRDWRIHISAEIWNAFDRVNDWAVRTINEYFAEFITCPDDVEDCAVYHIVDEEHVTLWSGDTIPTGYATHMRAALTPGSTPELMPVAREGLNSDGRGSWRDLRDTYSLAECEHCGYYYPAGELSSPDGMRQLCVDCEGFYIRCENCSNFMHQDESYEMMVYDELIEEDELLEVCVTCWDQHRREGGTRLRLQNYSYKPEWSFRLKGSKTEGPLLGMELEVARSQRADGPTINRWIDEVTEEGFLFCKSDSSVQYGLEIVTHPFTYEWAQEEFPFHHFEKLIKVPSIEPSHRSAGTHVHMAKAGFTSAHLWKFIKFHLDCDEFAGLVGERGATADYGSLKRNQREIKRNLKEIGRLKAANGNLLGLNRSIGINLTPSTTIELRYMAGNVNPDSIRKNLDWVQAVFEFTDMVSVKNAAKGALADPGYFLGFLEDREYTHLLNFLQQTIPTPKKLEE